MTAPGAVGARLGPRLRVSRERLMLGIAAVAVFALGIAVSHVSTIAFAGLVAMTLGMTAYAAVRWPLAALLLVIVTPMLDQYVVRLLLPDDVSRWTRFLSEAMLVVAGVTIAAVALRDGRLLPALRHPASIALGAFLAIALLSWAVNGVPPVPAVAGLAFTVDAIALFFLARMVPFDRRRAYLAVIVVVGLALVTALFAIAQALLSPDLLGFPVVRGNFGEPPRVAAFLTDPAPFGVLMGAGAAFCFFNLGRLGSRRRDWIVAGAAFVLVLALVLSFSRGSWLAMVVGFGVVALLVNRRVLMLAIAIGALAVATAQVMPRNLIVVREPGVEPPPAATDVIGSTGRRVRAIREGGDLRAMFVQNAIPILLDHPLVGVGPGRYGGAAARTFESPIYEAYGTDALFWDPAQQTVDNFWLHLIVEYGVLGATAFLALYALAWVPALRCAMRGRLFSPFLAAVAAFGLIMAVSGVTGMLLEGNAVSFAMWFFLGVASLLVTGFRDRAGGRNREDATAATVRLG
ncbi:MAG TPA: O-antigen ligase family protein [Candidatus Limnocylindria bacterium]|nr:O-antigen ligase family protein [Candidatus Limnocylindria bacterium]